MKTYIDMIIIISFIVNMNKIRLNRTKINKVKGFKMNKIWRKMKHESRRYIREEEDSKLIAKHVGIYY